MKFHNQISGFILVRILDVLYLSIKPQQIQFWDLNLHAIKSYLTLSISEATMTTVNEKCEHLQSQIESVTFENNLRKDRMKNMDELIENNNYDIF